MMGRRMNLIIDEAQLKEAKQLLAADSHSSTVNLALAEVVRISKLKSLTNYFGTGALAIPLQ